MANKENTHLGSFDRSAERNVLDAPVTEYVCKKTGFRVYLVQVKRPLVDAVFVVPTEASNNAGCPHTLEHLVFLGSQKYPYKGVLDACASRCLAEGTDAWTATDHTAYTITTAGSDGFLNILGVYLDHILHPLFSEDDFLTEIHAISDNGINMGVVYSEMEDHEFSCKSVVGRAVMETLYPKPSGYRYETGGRLDDLRNLTYEDIKEFHRKYYGLNNMALVIIGTIPEEDLFSRLVPILEAEVQTVQEPRGALASEQRPWTTSSPLPTLSGPFKRVEVVFPSTEKADHQGEVVLGWRGPCWTSFIERHIINILGEYLTWSGAAPLQKEFINITYPFASDVEFSEEAFKDTMYQIRFTDVPRKRAKKLQAAFAQTLQDITTKGIDMERLRAIINQNVAHYEQVLEASPEEGYLYPLIEFIVNRPEGQSENLFQEMWNVEEHFLNILAKKDAAFWIENLRRYFIDVPIVEVIGMPCSRLAATVEHETQALVKKQRQFVQSHNQKPYLERWRKATAAAAAQQSLPKEVVNSIRAADIRKVQTFTHKFCSNIAGASTEDSSNGGLKFSLMCSGDYPYLVHLCDTPSQFVEVRFITRLPLQPLTGINGTSVSPLSEEEAGLVFFLAHLLFDSGASTRYFSNTLEFANGNSIEEIPFDTYSNLLIQHLVSYEAFVGLHGGPASNAEFPELFTVLITARKNKILELAEFLVTTLRGLIFTPERILSLAQSKLGAVLRKKRRAGTVAACLDVSIRFPRTNPRSLASILHQQTMLRRIIQEPQLYADKLTALYKKVFQQSAVPPLLHIVGRKLVLEESPKFFLILKEHASESLQGVGPSATYPPLHVLWSFPPLTANRCPSNNALPFGNAVVSPSSSKDGGCLLMTLPGPVDPHRSDYASLMALTELLSSCEGPLFTAVRGSGAAYGVSFDYSFVTGELFLKLLTCSDVPKAFSTAMQAIQNCLESPVQYVHPYIETSKCTALFQVIQTEATASDYALEHLYNLCANLPGTFSRDLIPKIAEITVESLQAAIHVYLKPFLSFTVSPTRFSNGNSLAVSVPLDQEEAVAVQLQESKFIYPDTQGSSTPQITRVEWNNVAAWSITGDATRIDVIKPLKNEKDMINSDDESEEEEEQSGRRGKKTREDTH